MFSQANETRLRPVLAPFGNLEALSAGCTSTAMSSFLFLLLRIESLVSS